MMGIWSKQLLQLSRKVPSQLLLGYARAGEIKVVLGFLAAKTCWSDCAAEMGSVMGVRPM